MIGKFPDATFDSGLARLRRADGVAGIEPIGAADHDHCWHR